MKAMIFAAGKGTRLGRITETIPKALVDINGKTALRTAVEKCGRFGFDDIIVNVHHLAGMVEKEIRILQSEGYRISVSDERDQLLETGGGLYKAREFFGKEPFLVYNVDIVTDLDLKKMYDFHLLKKGIATIAVRHRKGNRFFLTDSEGILRGWRNRATGEEMLITKVPRLNEIGFLGIHVIDPEIFNYMEEGVYSMTKLYLSIAARHKVYSYLYDDGYWGDIGTPESLENARKISRHAFIISRKPL